MALRDTLADPGPRARTIAAALSAVCMVLSCPAFDIWWLAIFGWVPWLWAIEGLPARKALRYGWLTGTITVFWGFFWMSELLTKFAGFPLIGALPLTLLFALWHGGLWGLSAYGVAWIRARSDASLLWLLPAVWVAVEALLPNIFPIYMALAWSRQPLWIQAAEIGGVTMVSALMLALNAALYRTLRSWLVEGTLERRAAIVTAVLLVGIPSYGAVRIRQVEADMAAAPKLAFGVVQGNMSIFELRVPNRRHVILRKQQAKTAELQAQGAEIALWGETAYPNGRSFVRSSVRDLSPGDPWKVQQDFSIPVVFGTVTRDVTGAEPYPFNTAILLDGEGRVVGMYDKVFRLVFGEYVPVVDPRWYLRMVPNASHIAQGKGADVMVLGQWRLGPFICYEDILPRFVRDAANQRVHAFVNLTNDAWFGLTDEPLQHLGYSVFRSVEHRRAMLRSVNTGTSAYVDPTGRIVHEIAATDPDTQGPQPAEGFVADVPMLDPDRQTIYGLTGETFDGIMIFLVVVAVVRARRPRPGRGPASERAQADIPTVAAPAA